MSKYVAVAWLCLWAIRPTATILGVFILVPGHQISSRCTVCGSGASAPHRLHLWPREESWTGGGRGGPGLTRGRGGRPPPQEERRRGKGNGSWTCSREPTLACRSNAHNGTGRRPRPT